MAYKPKSTTTITTVEAPRSSLSGSDIASPYKMLATGLEKVGEVLDDVATAGAEEAGLRAVSKDADGNIVVDRVPFFTQRSATAFSRAVKFKATAESEAKLDRDLTEMRQQFANDPAGFDQAAEGYISKLQSNLTQAAGIEVGEAVGRMAERSRNQIYRGLLNDHERLTLTRARSAIDSRIKSVAEDMEIIARRGGIGKGSDYSQKLSDLDTLLSEKVNNPLFAFPRETADTIREAAVARAQGAAVLNQLETIYAERGFEDARSYLKSTVRDLGGGSLKMASHVEREGLAWLRQEEARFAGERDAVAREWAVAKSQAETLPVDALMDIEERARRAGAVKVARDVAATHNALTIVGDIRALPPSERLAAIRTGEKPGGENLTQSREGLQALFILKRDLSRSVASRISELEALSKKMEFPPRDEVQALVEEVGVIGSTEQRQRVAELAALSQYGKDFVQMPAAQRAQAVSEWDAKIKAGAPKFERDLSETLRVANDRINTFYRKDPYGAAYRFAEGMKPLPAIDYGRADIERVILDKLAQQNQIRADQGFDAFSILRPEEAETTASLLTTAQGAAAGGILGLFARTLPADVYEATLTSEPIKRALVGMTQSADPDRVTASMATLDRLWRANPTTFQGEFKGVLPRLQLWQSLKDSFAPAEIVERMQRTDDPAQAKARDALGGQAADELKKIPVGDVVSAFSQSFFSSPGVPLNIEGLRRVDGIQQERLKAEFDIVYRSLREIGVPAGAAKEKAVERMRAEWGPSEIMSGRLMRFPPERHYPAVAGSHSWLSDEVKTLVQPAGTFRALIADAQTEAEIAAKRPPSYRIVITNASGRDELFADASGNTRFAFDPTKAAGAVEDRFMERRRLMQSLPTFNIGAP